MSELTTLFKNTADAIRSKTGDTATIKASQFPAKIQGISVGISQDEADARYLQLSGGTMTGDLKVQESPASAKSAVSKSYAQGLFASALPKSGGTMTGALILNGAPTADNQAANKKYVDDKLSGAELLYSANAVYIHTYSTSLTVAGDFRDAIRTCKGLIFSFEFTRVPTGTITIKAGNNANFGAPLADLGAFDSTNYQISCHFNAQAKMLSGANTVGVINYFGSGTADVCAANPTTLTFYLYATAEVQANIKIYIES